MWKFLCVPTGIYLVLDLGISKVTVVCFLGFFVDVGALLFVCFWEGFFGGGEEGWRNRHQNFLSSTHFQSD